MADDNEPVAGSLFAYLEAADRDHLLTLGVRRTFPANETLLRQGDPTDHVLTIVSGWVRVYSTTPGGREVLVALRGPGDVVGDLAALHGWPRTGSVATVERVTAIQLRSTQFMHCLHARPTIAIGMLRQMSARLRQAELARMDFAALDVSRRVAMFLMRLAGQHGEPGPAGITLRVPLTQQDLANGVGASRRAVARSLAVLRERRIVNTSRRRIVIIQPEVLGALARTE